jgi:deoxyribonuclease-4
MRLGVHTRLPKGLAFAAESAAVIGCESIQVFAANPNAWTTRPIDPSTAEIFRQHTADSGLDPVVIHTQYLINLASPDPEIYERSIRALADSLVRAQALGARYVVTHIGSHRGTGFRQGMDQVCQAVARVCSGEVKTVRLLLENSAGSGNSMGSTFDELASILNGLDAYREMLGICLDTAHLWGAGYDISSIANVERIVAEFDSIVGLDRLMLLHLNDTKVELGSRKDRHANIGTGHIGEPGFKSLLHCQALVQLTGIIETPPRNTAGEERDIDILKRLRDG